MKFLRGLNLTAAGLIGALALTTVSHAQRTGESIDTRIGKLSFTHDFANGYPTQETVEKLFDERDFQRATQIYLWALPMVSLGEVEQVLMSTPGAAHGDIFRADTVPAIRRFLTGNATTPYLMTWLNLQTSGPLVVEIPAGPTAGFVNDLWQRPVTDIGVPGPDKGKGGKFLVLGPGQAAPKESAGYIVVHSTTFNNLWLIRLLSPEARERDAMMAKIRIYPFSKRAAPPPDQGALGGSRVFVRERAARLRLLGEAFPLGQRRARAGARPHHGRHAALARH